MNLDLSPALSRPELLAKATAAALADWPGGADAEVAPIDPELADTAAFCEHYGVELTESAHCVVVATGMEYGGITPVGLPDGWPIFIDARVVEQAHVIVGSGIRGSKLRLPGP